MNKRYKDKVEFYINICNNKMRSDSENKVDSFQCEFYKHEMKGFDDVLGDKCNVTIMQKVYTQSNNIFTDLFDADNMPTEKDISHIYSQYKKCFEEIIKEIVLNNGNLQFLVL